MKGGSCRPGVQSLILCHSLTQLELVYYNLLICVDLLYLLTKHLPGGTRHLRESFLRIKKGWFPFVFKCQKKVNLEKDQTHTERHTEKRYKQAGEMAQQVKVSNLTSWEPSHVHGKRERALRKLSSDLYPCAITHRRITNTLTRAVRARVERCLICSWTVNFTRTITYTTNTCHEILFVGQKGVVCLKVTGYTLTRGWGKCFSWDRCYLV